MGMKKSNALGIIGFAMMMSEGLVVPTNIVDTSTPYKPPTQNLTPFKKQDRIVKLIKDFNLIQNGQSKKGKRKQAQTITKINEMIKKGYLTKDDIKL